MPDPIVSLNEKSLKSDLRGLVRKTVEGTLYALLEEETDGLVEVERHKRTADREAYRAGHYERKLTTTSGEVTIRMPKLKGMRFTTAIIERYRRRETSVEDRVAKCGVRGTRHRNGLRPRISFDQEKDSRGRRPQWTLYSKTRSQ